MSRRVDRWRAALGLAHALRTTDALLRGRQPGSFYTPPPRRRREAYALGRMTSDRCLLYSRHVMGWKPLHAPRRRWILDR
jgi:hypothetical protein